MTTKPERDAGSVLGARIDALSRDAALDRPLGWAHARESRYLTITLTRIGITPSWRVTVHLTRP